MGRRVLGLCCCFIAAGSWTCPQMSAQEGKPQGVEKPASKKGDRPSQEPIVGKNTMVRADQSYGRHPNQRLDVYAPAGVTGAPVVIFVHGGEWTKGDKRAVSYKPKFLNENGIAFVSINYRLSPEAMHPAHVGDVAAAIRWVRDHAAGFGGDPNKLVLMGHSAGCHLATLTALDPRYLKNEGLLPTSLRGVAAWSGGMYDLVDRVKTGTSYTAYIHQAFGQNETNWREASPVAHIGDGPMPAFLFISTESGNPSHKAAEDLASRIRSAKGQAETQVLTDRTHFTANHLLGAPDDKTGAILIDFVRRSTR